MEFGGIVRDLSRRCRFSLSYPLSISFVEQCQSVFSSAEFNLNCISTGSAGESEEHDEIFATYRLCLRKKKYPDVRSIISDEMKSGARRIRKRYINVRIWIERVIRLYNIITRTIFTRPKRSISSYTY